VIDDLKVPSFGSEEEEAEWWFQNREEITDGFVRAASEKRLKSGSTALRRAREADRREPVLTIHLSEEDSIKIRRLAAEHGQGEEECAASILHQALENV
jgi:hypothetical protein